MDDDMPANRFADAARRLGASAHAEGLTVPAFRTPPRIADVDRTIRRYPGATVVAVRVAGRRFAEVLGDMIEGVLVTNRVTPEDAPRLRHHLRAAVVGDTRGRARPAAVAPAHGEPPAARAA